MTAPARSCCALSLGSFSRLVDLQAYYYEGGIIKSRFGESLVSFGKHHRLFSGASHYVQRLASHPPCLRNKSKSHPTVTLILQAVRSSPRRRKLARFIEMRAAVVYKPVNPQHYSILTTGPRWSSSLLALPSVRCKEVDKNMIRGHRVNCTKSRSRCQPSSRNLKCIWANPDFPLHVPSDTPTALAKQSCEHATVTTGCCFFAIRFQQRAVRQ